MRATRNPVTVRQSSNIPSPITPGMTRRGWGRGRPCGLSTRGGGGGCEQDRSVPGTELSPHLPSALSSLTMTTRDMVPGQLALFPLLLTFLLTLPFRNLISKSAN